MRVLLKISGEMLTNSSNPVERECLESLKNELSVAYNAGTQIAIVVGGGNIWRGRDTQSLGIFRGKSDSIGMLATVMNALSFSAFLEENNMKTAVFSSRSMPSFCEEFSIDKAENAFSKERICFFCGGTGSPFFTTDSACALKAIETKCDFIGKATTVDGVYDCDPRKNPDAKKYDAVSFDEVIEKNLQVMDTAAFALARENRLSIQIFDGSQEGNIAKILAGEKIGTIVS